MTRVKRADSLFARDLATLLLQGPIQNHVQDATYIHAMPCLRFDFTCPAPLAQRPADVDALFAQVASFLQGRLRTYGGEPGFAASRGRKARQSDVDQLGRLSALMDQAALQDAQEKAQRKAALMASGNPPIEGPLWDPVDFGTLFLGDADRPRPSLCGTHVQLLGFGSWRGSISFDLELAASKAEQMFALVEALFLSGLAASASFGFAYNLDSGRGPAFCRHHYVPPTRRFALLTMTEPASIDVQFDDLGIAPIGAWYWIDKATAKRNGMREDQILALQPHIHQLIANDHGYLLKLYAAPVLGDLDRQDTLAPALALGKLLDPAIKAAPVLRGVGLGARDAQLAWLRRFAPSTP